MPINIETILDILELPQDAEVLGIRQVVREGEARLSFLVHYKKTPERGDGFRTVLIGPQKFIAQLGLPSDIEIDEIHIDDSRQFIYCAFVHWGEIKISERKHE